MQNEGKLDQICTHPYFLRDLRRSVHKFDYSQYEKEEKNFSPKVSVLKKQLDMQENFFFEK